MEFAVPAWDPYRVKDINKLEMVQRHAARFAKSDYRRTTSVSKLVDDLGWRTLSDAALRLTYLAKQFTPLTILST